MSDSDDDDDFTARHPRPPMSLEIFVWADGSASTSIEARDPDEFRIIVESVPDLVATLRDEAHLAGKLRALTDQLAHSTQPLADAVAAAGGPAPVGAGGHAFLSRSQFHEANMNPLDQAFADLTAQVAETSGAEDSATVLIPGLVTQLEAALAAGNPTQQIAKVRDVIAAMKTHTDPLAAAVAAVPPAPPPPPVPAP